MEELAHVIAALIKLGVGLCLAIALFIYGAYALESHCMNPMGCKPPPGAYDQGAEWDAAQKRWAEMDRRSSEIGHRGRP